MINEHKKLYCNQCTGMEFRFGEFFRFSIRYGLRSWSVQFMQKNRKGNKKLATHIKISMYRISDPIYHSISITNSIVIVNFSTSFWPSAFGMNIHLFACTKAYSIQYSMFKPPYTIRTPYTVQWTTNTTHDYYCYYCYSQWNIKKQKRLKPRGELVSWWIDCYFIRFAFFCHFNCLNVSNTYCRFAAVIVTVRSSYEMWMWLKIDFCFSRLERKTINIRTSHMVSDYQIKIVDFVRMALLCAAGCLLVCLYVWTDECFWWDLFPTCKWHGPFNDDFSLTYQNVENIKRHHTEKRYLCSPNACQSKCLADIF